MVSDAKFIVFSDNVIDVTDILTPEIVSATDYYPFGMPISDHKVNSADYRYGHNGQEKDEDVGHGIYTAEFWQYDSKIARRWNVDPIFDPSTSPYACFSDNPIMLSDPNGDTP